MRIDSVRIENFKAIRNISIDDLGGLVVLAGGNGCGKSCVLDAIRLFKSSYGGYQPNEWQNWFSEFQIDYRGRPQQLSRVFRDPKKPVTIELALSLSAKEKKYFRDNAEEIALSYARQRMNHSGGVRSTASEQRELDSEVRESAKAYTSTIKSETRKKQLVVCQV